SGRERSFELGDAEVLETVGMRAEFLVCNAGNLCGDGSWELVPSKHVGCRGEGGSVDGATGRACEAKNTEKSSDSSFHRFTDSRGICCGKRIGARPPMQRDALRMRWTRRPRPGSPQVRASHAR